MTEGGAAPIAPPETTQNLGSSSDVFFLTQRSPNLAQLMTDVNEALQHAGVFSSIPPTPSPFSWLDPFALPIGEAEPRANFIDNIVEGGNLDGGCVFDSGEDSGLSDLGDGPLVPPDEDGRSTHSNDSVCSSHIFFGAWCG
jgi:hypothetical protein